MKRIIVIIIGVLLAVSGCQKEVPKAVSWSFKGQTMGTTYLIKLGGKGLDDSQHDKIHRDIDNQLATINNLMSIYNVNSEISAFNRLRDTGWFKLSEETYTVFSKAQEISGMSGGAFDITVGPLVNLWGFGNTEKEFAIPSPAQIKKAQERCGYRKLFLNDTLKAVKKVQPDIFCDLSGIAKGYGVDVIAGYLDLSGIEDYMVEIGGEVITRGKNTGGQAWQIGIESPESVSGIKKAISLSDIALATSGDYYSYVEKDGVRYSHTIDPRTGRPVEHNIASVSVLYPDCMTADAIATAINVLGPKEGLKLAENNNLPVYFLIREGESYREIFTEPFKRYLKPGNKQ